MSASKPMPHYSADWRGYTLDELRYMKAYTAARIEINRDRIKRNAAEMKNFSPVRSHGILGKILGTLSYLDIALVTFRVASRLFRTVRWLRRR